MAVRVQVASLRGKLSDALQIVKLASDKHARKFASIVRERDDLLCQLASARSEAEKHRENVSALELLTVCAANVRPLFAASMTIDVRGGNLHLK